MEKLASYADKVEKRWVKFIVSAHVLERISQVAKTGEEPCCSMASAQLRSAQESQKQPSLSKLGPGE